MGIELIAQLIGVLAPVIIDTIKELREENGDVEPTTEEIQQRILDKTAAEVLEKGAAWRATHPRA